MGAGTSPTDTDCAGYAARCLDWEYSAFHRYVRLGMLPENWGGTVIVRDKMQLADWD